MNWHGWGWRNNARTHLIPLAIGGLRVNINIRIHIHHKLCPAVSPRVFAPADVPGFTRSVYSTQYALLAPESRVFVPQPGW